MNSTDDFVRCLEEVNSSLIHRCLLQYMESMNARFITRHRDSDIHSLRDSVSTKEDERESIADKGRKAAGSEPKSDRQESLDYQTFSPRNRLPSHTIPINTVRAKV